MLNQLDFKNLRGDLFGGITAGIVALPLALAFGISSGLGAAAGLYGAIFLGFWASLLGGTPSQISGPTGPMTVVSSVFIADAISHAGTVADALGIIIITFVLTGLIQIGLGVLRLGQYIRYIPHPVVSGFMSGIGLIVIQMQINPMLGLDNGTHWINIWGNQNINLWAILFTLLTIAIVYLFPKLLKSFPSTLAALIIVSLIAYFSNIPLAKIGEIPMGFPVPPFLGEQGLTIFPNLAEIPWHLILTSAFTLAALGAIDSLLTSVVADNLTKTRHKSNQELIGQGIGNTFAGIFGGLPGAGATMRTVVNLRSGGKSGISGLLHSIVLLFILLGLGGLASEIPMAVLAGILITVGIGIIDYEGLRHIKTIPVQDTLVMLVVFILTVTVDLLLAVSVGMVMASIFFMKKMGDNVRKRSSMLVLKDYLEFKQLKTNTFDDELLLQTKVFEIDGPFFFGAVHDILGLMRESTNYTDLILDLKKVTHYDETGLLALRDGILELQERNIDIYLIGVSGKDLNLFVSHHIYGEIVSEAFVFDSLAECLTQISTEKAMFY